MVYQYAINTKEIVSLNDVTEYLSIISDERRQRITRFYFIKDKIHSLFAEIILRYALCERYGFSNEYIKFYYSEYGKPYLLDHNDVYFNLSHSGSWVICGIGSVPLGVDVEEMKKKELSIANKIYTKEENYSIFTQSSENRIKTFYKIWTLKESYVKNVGKGLSIPFDSFSFLFHEDDIQFYIKGERNHSFSFSAGQLDDQHSVAICVNTKSRHMINENIKILTLQELMKWKDRIFIFGKGI